MFGTLITKTITTVSEALAPAREKIAAFMADVREIHNRSARGELNQLESEEAVRRIEAKIAQARHEGARTGLATLQASIPTRQAKRQAAARTAIAAREAFVTACEALQQVETEWTREAATPELRTLLFDCGLPRERHLHRVFFGDDDPGFKGRLFREQAARDGLDLGDGRLQQMQARRPKPVIRRPLPLSAQ